jgi:hypothetical protein
MTDIQEDNEFTINELCWAKLKGYPWWPAIIKDIILSKNKKKCYIVGYFCEKRGSSLSEINIKKWKQNYEIFKDGKGKGKQKNSGNDFISSLTVAKMYDEGKIDINDHESFVNKYQNNKDRHSLKNIKDFFNEIIKKKKENQENKENKENKENIKKEEENDENALIANTKEFGNNSDKKLLRKKRNISKNKDIIEIKDEKDNEFNIKQKDLNKIDDLVNNIAYNVDEILIKSEKYQKFFDKECKERNISMRDNKAINMKLELIKYLETMTEVLNVPINLNNMIQSINNIK